MKLISILCLLLLACESPAELEKRQQQIAESENGGTLRFKRLSKEWCQKMYNSDCNSVCNTDAWGVSAVCDVSINGTTKHIACGLHGCTESVSITPLK